MSTGPRSWAAWLLLILVTQPAPGHLVYGRLTLSQMVHGADAVVVARIIDEEAVLAVDTHQRRPVISAEILEVLKGGARPGPALVARHGHGHTSYQKDERALLFLTSIDRHRELQALKKTGRVDYVSLQETSANFRLDGPHRERLLAAVRDYANLAAIDEPDERLAALQTLTLELLRSPDGRIAASAARDLAPTAQTRMIDEEAVPQLVALVHDEEVLIGVRVAVLATLGQQDLVETAPHWARLVAESESADAKTAIRAAGAHPSEAVARALLTVVSKGSPPEAAKAAEAAVAVGWPGNDAAVPTLARALESDDARLRLAAIRGLSGIATAAARETLEKAAASHHDPAVRRRAAAAAGPRQQ
jgi:hypothetical protein